MSASYATHKLNYDFEPYLTHINIKKHRNSLAKLRLSDHQLQIQKGRQTRPSTPRHLRVCKVCQNKIEDEAHFLFECTNDDQDSAKIKNKYLKYKFIMNVQDPECLKSLGYTINVLFKNLENLSEH